jgi:hypothetical protein
MIQGYPDDASAFPGDTITFHVATDAPQFRIDFYRQGATLQSTGVSTSWLKGSPGDPHDPDQDWGEQVTREDDAMVPGWQGFPFTIPDWDSGVYIAMFVEGDGNDNPNLNQNPPLVTTTPDARSGKALFVVKNQSPGVASQVLYKVPLFTYQMYNLTTYTSIDNQTHAGSGYVHAIGQMVSSDGTVSLHRPGGGTGGTPWDVIYFSPPNNDPLDVGSLRQTFVHWDAKMISWLEGNGFRIDYCTDMDAHRDDDLSLLSPYALVLSVGHDEYYSTAMRDHLEAYVANGGNIAFFSGNTAYWRLIFPVIDGNNQPDLRFITRDYEWAQLRSMDYPNAPQRPEDSLTGVGFRHGGERNYPLPKNGTGFVGYKVQNTILWPFENSGLAENDTFGKDACIVGYEADGTPFDPNAARPVSPSFNPADATPAGLIILGTADGDIASWQYPAALPTMAMYTNSGTVFNGGTTDWPRVLAQGDAPTVAITTNVMNRLGGNPKGLATLGNVANLICCDGFFSSDDNYRHAIVGTDDGGVTEIFFNPTIGIGQTQLVTQASLLDVGSFYSDDDQYRHVITATADGNIWEVFYSPKTGLGQAQLGNFPDVMRVAGFYSSDDNYRHAIVATRAGEVFELYFSPSSGQGQALLGTFDNIVDIGAFYSPDDQFRHVIVGTADGTVTEIYFNPGFGVGRRWSATCRGSVG